LVHESNTKLNAVFDNQFNKLYLKSSIFSGHIHNRNPLQTPCQLPICMKDSFFGQGNGFNAEMRVLNMKQVSGFRMAAPEIEPAELPFHISGIKLLFIVGKICYIY
jgi:hypothetical protein